MILTDAKKLLPEFYSLMGYYSKDYDSKVDAIYVGFIDQNLTYLLRNPRIGLTIETFDPQPNDYGSHTVCVQFENNKVEGVRNLVEKDLDNLGYLISKAELLDSMNHSKNDIPLK